MIHDGYEGLIEGDERWHVDGARTPQVRGTGTEDIFNSGWYYGRGRLITALHGANSTRSEGWIDQIRWYVGDSIPFAGRLTGGVEHGGLNDANADYSSWTTSTPRQPMACCARTKSTWAIRRDSRPCRQFVRIDGFVYTNSPVRGRR